MSGKINTQLLKTLESVTEKIDFLKTKKIEKILDKYEDIPEEFKSLEKLTNELKRVKPNLFSEEMMREEITSLDLEKILEKKEKRNSEKISLEDVYKTVEDAKDSVEELKKELETLLPEHGFIHYFRVKSKESLLSNSKEPFPHYRLNDVIGFRVVPKSPTQYLGLLDLLENAFYNDIKYKLNFFSFSDKELDIMPLNISPYYKAIHYYIPTDKVYTEIQVRPPATDIWSEIDHKTRYKPQIETTPEEKKVIENFGRKACCLDLYEILLS